MGWKQPYYWVGRDGGFKVGTPADIENQDDTLRPAFLPAFLMKHSHTGELEWVRPSQLTPYPSSPIPNPGE